MQALRIVDLVDKAARMSLGKRLVLVERDLLLFERLEEALGLGVVVGIACGRDVDLGADLLPTGHIGHVGVLHPSVGMVDQARCGLTPGQRQLQGCERERRIEPAGKLPAHDTARVGVEQAGQIDKAGGQTDVGEIGNPGLVALLQRRARRQQIGIGAIPMRCRGGGGDNEVALQLAEQPS